MKSCPKCRSVYYDETLEFCMEDGSRLHQTSPEKDEIPTIISNKIRDVLAEKTLEFNIKPAENENLEKYPETVLNNKTNIDKKITNFKEKVSYQGLRTIEVFPIILALANNYWQWLYLNKSDFGDTFSFLISINFIVWFLLLTFGLISSFIALKYGKSRGFAITSLVILSINLLLSIVPLK